MIMKLRHIDQEKREREREREREIWTRRKSVFEMKERKKVKKKERYGERKK